MQIILLENIRNLGSIGDTVTVKNGFGRNFLLKQGKALRFNKDNLELVNKKKDELNKKNSELKNKYKEIAKLIHNKTFIFNRESKDNGELYGSIKPKEITSLVKENANILLIEEGGDYINPFLKMPAGFIPMLDGSPYHRFHKTILQTQLNNRQHDIAQGKILGGGSSINGMVYMRGRPSDYEVWEKEVDDKFWSWEHLLNSYVSLEGNQRLNNKYHGINGPLKVSDPKYVVKGTDL